MKTKTLLATLALALAPSIGFAACSGYGHSETASISCAEGSVYDADTKACVPVANS